MEDTLQSMNGNVVVASVESDYDIIDISEVITEPRNRGGVSVEPIVLERRGQDRSLQNEIDYDPHLTVRAQDRFVSTLTSGDAYANHRLSKVLTNLLSTRPPDSVHPLLLKVIFVGDAMVGKSDFVVRICSQTQSSGYVPTIGVDFQVLRRYMSDPIVPETLIHPLPMRVQMWDTAGTPRFRRVTQAFYRGSNGSFLCYSVRDRNSFNNLNMWLDDIRQFTNPLHAVVLLGLQADADLAPLDPHAGPPAELTDDERKALVAGRQIDRLRRRAVSYAEGQALAQQIGCAFVECSSRDGLHLDDAMATMLHHILRKRMEEGGSCLSWFTRTVPQVQEERKSCTIC